MFRSVAQQLAAALFCAAVSFALTVYLGRALGAEDFGRYAALLSLAVVILPLLEGGWPPRLYRDGVVLKELPRDPHAPGHASAHLLAVTAAICLAAALVATPSRQMPVPPLVAALWCMGVVAGANLVSARMRGAGAFGLEAVWRVAARCVSALAIVLAVFALHQSVSAIFLAWGLGLLLLLGTAGRRWLALPHWRGLAGSYRALAPLLVLELFVAVLAKGDIAIAAQAGLAAAPLSYYAASSRVAEAALLLFAPFVIVLLRSLRLHADAPAAYRRELHRALAVAATCGLLVLGLGWIGREHLMPLLFGPEFSPAGALLPWVLASMPAAFVAQVLIQGVVARHRERGLPWRLGLAALGICAAIVAGTRLDGARGAAIGFCLGQVLLVALLAPLARAERT